MKASTSQHKFRFTELTTQVQVVIAGIAFSELWYFTQIIASAINKYISTSGLQVAAISICIISFVITLLYAYFRNVIADSKWLWNSNRTNILGLCALAALGFTTSAITGGIGTNKYQQLVNQIPAVQLIFVFSIPLAIALLFIFKSARKRNTENNSSAFFLNDQDIKQKDEDLLDVSESANRFALRVLNGGASDSLVFGIDAPWGIGKSSFVNFCCEYWENDTKPQPIVHRFEPLRYIDNTNLVEKFIYELINTIQEHIFDPSIESLFSKYLRQIRGKSELSFLGFKFELEPSAGSIDKTLEGLKIQLAELNKKIIIVIDDLDRLSWPEVKSILFAIKQSFMLPNVTYILCYDTENLASIDETYNDAEQVKEFLEKYVNVKIGLYLDTETLSKYVSANIADAINRNLQLDTHLLDQIKQALQGLEEIYKSNDFVFYQPFIGDVRKLKRLINTMMLFEIQTTDFNNSDYNKKDLLHLLLVYIKYPNIFRMIYNSETGGKSGFFSLILKTDTSSKSKFEHSTYYKSFVDKLANQNQVFLLEKIFGEEVPYESNEPKVFGSGEIDKAAKMSRACFNGDGYTGRNLERYLNLIIKLSKQDKRDGYQFYVTKKDELVSGAPLEKILQSDDFSFSNGEFTRDQLWMIIGNSAHEMSPSIASQLVLYIMNHLPEYSFFERENIGVGLRTKLIYSLLKVLDAAAWGDSLSGRRNNTNENISEIAEWVFGEGRHKETNVLNTLAKPERGPLGLFDLLLFRLYCSADRGGSLFNLQRAIAIHGSPDAPTSGVTTKIAKEGMREISQKVFHIFADQYIDRGINIIEAIDKLSLTDFAGKSTEFIGKQISNSIISNEVIEQLIAAEKSKAKAFIIYQLGNSFISSGVGCGYYDEAGNNDNKGIALKINDYLFNQCFEPSKNPKNYERFLDYLLINFSGALGDWDGFKYIPTIGEFTKVLQKERLITYWNLHRDNILKLNFTSQEKFVATGNYTATYEEDLPDVYRTLDEMLQDKTSQ